MDSRIEWIDRDADDAALLAEIGPDDGPQVRYDSAKEWRGDTIIDQNVVDGETVVSVQTVVNDRGLKYVNIVRGDVLVASLTPYMADVLAYHLNMASGR